MRREESLLREEALAAGEAPVVLPDLGRLPPARLAGMLAAGEEILECYRVLRKAGLNVVGEVLRGTRKFREFDHYPKGDVYDRETRSQYYYHAHRGITGEHGHFHTFMRSDDAEGVVHLVAISMDAYGYPTGLFIPNRWVAAGAWYSVDELREMLPRFRVDHAWPSWPVNRWISAMLALYGPHIEQLLLARDETLAAWRALRPGEDLLESRDLEILAQTSISVDQTLAEIGRLLS
jgi:hypothetical protein